MPLVIAVAAFLAHVATDWRYGYFRDELYFIACAKHLSWGYVDQPPLVAFDAWLSGPLGYNLIVLRLLPSLAAAVTVWLAARIASDLGGGRFAQSLAALTAFVLPAYLLLGNTLTTTSFEPFSWTLFIYIVIRMARTGDRRLWIAAGAAFAFGMYGKYSMLLLGVSIAAGLMATRERKLLATWWFPAAILCSGVLLAPNLLWQWAHAWPFVQVVQGDFAHRHAFQTGLELEYRNVGQNGLAFIVEQLVYTNPIAALIWILGLAAPAFCRRFAALRFLAVTYGVLLLLAIALEAKGYYIIGVYAALLAAGSVVVESVLQSVTKRALLVAVLVVTSVVFLPISLPVLPVDSLIAYTRALHLTGRNGTEPRLIQPLFAEEFGWDELTRHVAAVYNSLPPRTRARTGVFADTYGDAGGLEFYGSRYGLPRVISAQNTYYLWGTDGYDGSTLIVVGATQADVVRSLYRRMKLVATYGNPYKWIVEGPTPIYLCSDPIAPLPAIWPRLRWYGA